jgi:hypothetical protein
MDILDTASRCSADGWRGVISEIASLHQHHLTCMFPKRVDPWEQTK